MTPIQKERIAKKITDIKRILAAEKRKFGGYEDSRGLRYLPPKFFVKLCDYSGGLTYIKWFYKNFPDDIGFPDFLFECTIILFKKGKLKEAGKKAFETFCRNNYLFDKYFGRPIIPIDKWEGSNLEGPSYTAYLEYSYSQTELADFTGWLDKLITSSLFIERSTRYINIYKKLKTEHDEEMRHYLLMHAGQLEKE